MRLAKPHSRHSLLLMTSPRYISASRLALSVALIAAAFSAGCRKHEASSVTEALPSAAVRVAVVEQKARPSSEEVVGTVRAKLRVAIEAKVSGLHRGAACRAGADREGR